MAGFTHKVLWPRNSTMKETKKAVSRPENAVAIAPAWKPDFIFLDIVMPTISGYEAARQLRKSAGLERTKIIALTGYPADVPAQELASIDGYVLKPISLDKVKELLGDIRQA